MKKILLVAGMMVLLAVSLGQAQVVKNISAAEAYQLLQRDARVFLLDVRTAQEYFDLRLKSARLIPIDQVVQRRAEVPQDRPVLVYCAVGSRSAQVANYLSRSGHSEVFNLIGGIYSWQLRGYPVLKGAP
ncbi:MAG: rhodanese-like domain-containing protein [Desulfuromonadales bacterium]|nr:rhodanese-like domain-containing protein [Desulfuromonadales bacterium]MDT8423287.1 rhodanese-like domain-containing protein [Desulfuromonadales bacterium]